MAKRKITVTVDEDLVAMIQASGSESLSGVVNQALAAHVERLGRREALGQLLDQWEGQFGPVSGEAAAAAQSAFDELDSTGRSVGLA